VPTNLSVLENGIALFGHAEPVLSQMDKRVAKSGRHWSMFAFRASGAKKKHKNDGPGGHADNRN
jgi:hypothetical protein